MDLLEAFAFFYSNVWLIRAIDHLWIDNSGRKKPREKRKALKRDVGYFY
jgi:hypothetical protein